MNLRSALSARGTQVSLLLYGIIAIVCTQAPLLNAVGYESAVAIALSGSMIAGFATVRRIQRLVRTVDPAGWSVRSVLQSFRNSVVLNLLLLAVPLAILLLNAQFVRNCSITEGLIFFLLIPVVSIWFSSALGLFCALQYRHGRVVFTLLVVASFGYAAALGYFTPAIFSYNFFYGYFPGLSYDEVLKVSRPLILFRLLTTVLGGILVWWGILIVKGSKAADSASVKGLALVNRLAAKKNRIAALCVVSGLALLFLYRCDLGWESTASHIQHTLGSEYRGAHFTIYYSSRDITETDLQRLAREHEFRLAQLLGEFGLADHPRIESYLYPNSEEKRKLIGTGTTNIAKPWNNQIHLTRQSIEGTLKHELTHVVAGQFGLPVIHASLSTGLVEGLATAQDLTWGNRTLHQYAAAMKRFDVVPDIEWLMTFTGFAAQSNAVSYVAAGSFCRYLMDAYGLKTLLKVYRTGDYRGAYGRPLRELIEEWNRFLGRIRVDENERDVIDALFRQRTIFRKTCARIVAERNEEARAAMASRNYTSALALYRRSLDETGGYESLSGVIAASIRLGDYRAVIRFADSLILNQKGAAQFLPLFIWCGDARWALGDTAGARELFERVERVDVAENLTEAAAVRLRALSDSTSRQSLLNYFLSDDPDSLRVERLDSLARQSPEQALLLRYLEGRVLARMGKVAEALAVLDSLNLFPISRELEGLRRKTVALQEYFLGRYDLARNTFWMSLNVLATEAAVDGAREWVTRCDWMARHGH
jgi:hypothetical protein